MKSRSAYLSVLLSFALFFAQVGALLHAVSHIKEGSTRQYSDPQYSDPQYSKKQLSVDKFCDQCLSFSTISAAPSYQLNFSLPFQIENANAAIIYQQVVLPPANSFHSRAPPFSKII